MDRKSSLRGESSTVDTSTVWFISFGDLLTLLLCFFLVLTPKFSLPVGKNSKKASVSAPLDLSANDGTYFARIDSKDPSKDALERSGRPLKSIPITVPLAQSQEVAALQSQMLAGLDVLIREPVRGKFGVSVKMCSGVRVDDLLSGVYGKRVALGASLNWLRVEISAKCDLSSWHVSSQREVVAVLDLYQV